MRFSERIGAQAGRELLQRDSMDVELRVAIWNQVLTLVLEEAEEHSVLESASRYKLYRKLWDEFFHVPLDDLPYGPSEFIRIIRKAFDEAQWYEVYDLVEWLARSLPRYDVRAFCGAVNTTLEREMSAYRFAGTTLVQITNELELAAVDEALTAARGWDAVEAHLNAAAANLSDRKEPNYRNSVKESVSAVEATCRQIVGDQKATLPDALKALTSVGVVLHPALREAWLKLYGYTSDANGIRHALTAKPDLTFAEAKYFLIHCSAFCHFVIELSQGAARKA